MQRLLANLAWFVIAVLSASVLIAIFLVADLKAQTVETAPRPATVAPAVLYPPSEAFPEGYVSANVEIPAGHVGVILGTDDLAHWVIVSELPEGTRDVSVVIPVRSARRFIRVHTFLTPAAREAWLAAQNFDGGFSGISGLVQVPTAEPTAAAAKTTAAKRASRR